MEVLHRGRPTKVTRATPYPQILSAAVWLPAAGAALALGFVAGISGADLLVAPISLVLFGAWRAGRSLIARQRARDAADAWIVYGHDDITAWYGWRIAELTAPRERRLLARSLRAVFSDVSSPRFTSAAPLNRRALRPHAQLLLEVAVRLDALDRPVRAAGVLAVQRLLTDPGSPLYMPSFDEAVESPERTIRTARDNLEVR